MFKHILVPLDGSSFSEQALPLALSIARRAEASVELVHVYPSTAYSDLPADQQQLLQGRQQAQAYLDGVAKRLRPSAPADVKTLLLDGNITETLLEHVQATGTDLLVLTTHGRGPLSRYWMGSVADDLLRQATVPLLLVRPQDEPADVSAEPTIGRILIPLDGSPFAEQILKPATAFGRLMQAELRLLRVVTPMVAPGHESWASPPLHVPIPDLQDQARTYLNRLWKQLQNEHTLPVRAHVTVEFNPGPAILEDAQSRDVDLIALATHGRTGISRLMLGSVADKVIRGSTVPVLVYRPTTTA